MDDRKLLIQAYDKIIKENLEKVEKQQKEQEKENVENENYQKSMLIHQF